MTRQIRILATGFLVLFGLLAANLNYLQVIAADDLANHEANKRLLIAEYRVDRGDILAGDSRTVLARSRETNDPLTYLRRYPEGELYAHITGYYSFVFGRGELESTQNDYLAAHAPELLPERLIDDILGRDRRGATVVTTLLPELQRAAAEALGGREGAVAAIDPSTGDVLALVANPSYDPNVLSSHDGDQIRRAWQQLNDDPDKPLLSRANDELFPPGSTFKIVTAAAALENGMTPETTVPNPPELVLADSPGNPLENFGGSLCPGGSEISLATALQVSCNVAFGEFGIELGGAALAEQARRFGFEESIPFDIPFAPGLIFSSNIPNAEALDAAESYEAKTAIGQQDVRTNVLHMALVAGAIGNGGVMMEPNLVAQIRDPSGRVIFAAEPEPFGEAMSAANAATLADMMEAVVSGGTGTAAQIPGVAVAGKTGTAQHAEDEPPHAWFVAFAPADAPRVAVAVVVLNGGDLGSEATGGAIAAPIAKTVMEAALSGG